MRRGGEGLIHYPDRALVRGGGYQIRGSGNLLMSILIGFPSLDHAQSQII